MTKTSPVSASTN